MTLNFRCNCPGNPAPTAAGARLPTRTAPMCGGRCGPRDGSARGLRERPYPPAGLTSVCGRAGGDRHGPRDARPGDARAAR